MPGHPQRRAMAQASLVGAVLLWLLTVVAGPPGVLAGAAGLGLAVAWLWPRLLDLPAPWGVRGVVAGVLVVAVLARWAAVPAPAWWAVPPAVAGVAALAHQVWRTDGRPRVADVLGAEVLGAMIVISGVSWSLGSATTVGVCTGSIALAALVECISPRAVGPVSGTTLGVVLGCAGGVTAAAFLGWAPELFMAAVAAPILADAARRVLGGVRLPKGRLPWCVGIAAILAPGIVAALAQAAA